MTKKLSRTVVNMKGGCVTHLLLGKIPLRHQKIFKKKKEKHGTLLKEASVDQCSFKELKWKLKNVQ